MGELANGCLLSFRWEGVHVPDGVELCPQSIYELLGIFGGGVYDGGKVKFLGSIA